MPPDEAAEPSEPRPGKTDSDGGAPPGGLATVWAGPARRSSACWVPPRPG